MKRFIGMISGLGLGFTALAAAACAPPINALRPTGNDSKVQRIGDVPKANTSYKVQFVSEQEGWLAGGENLWRTADGGKSWSLLYSGIGSSRMRYITDVDFASSQIGWILASSNAYKTGDGGITWRPLALPDSDLVLHSVELLKDGQHGWIAGETYRPVSRKEAAAVPSQLLSADGKEVLYPALFHTKDGGLTWIQQHLPSAEGRLLHLYFLDSVHGWASSDAEFFYLESSSNSWKIIDYSLAKCTNQMLLETTLGTSTRVVHHPVAIYFLDASQGWLGFENGYMAKTTDGGRTWCDLLNPRDVWPNKTWQAFFLKIHFTDSTHGWGLGRDGSLHETNDGGAVWQKVDTNVQFEAMYFLDSDSGWAVAKEGMYRIVP